MQGRQPPRQTSRLASAALAVALLAYPRSFRRRFGREVEADFERLVGDATATQIGRHLLVHVQQGLAERGSAIVRWSWWPNPTPHLYEPTGRHAMFWDALRSDVRFTLRQ